jgi:outer membrane lipoprotein-sorting protein
MRNSILASLCRVLALALACAVFTESAAEEESPDGLKAQQILDQMVSVYETCESYHDSGVVTNFFSPEHIDFKPFRTAFVRPDRFRFEYDDPDPEKPYIVWGKGDTVCTWWYVTPGVKYPTSLSHGIAGATGVSSGSAHTIPALLLPDRIGGRSMASLTDLTRMPDEAADDTLCFKLQGRFGDQATTLWLGKETYLIRRIVAETKLAKTTTVYRPEIAKEIPAEELEFNAPDQGFKNSTSNSQPNRHATMNIGGGEIILILVLLFLLVVGPVVLFGLIYLIVRVVQKRPPPAPPTLPPEVMTRDQQRRDREHLKLLSIFHFVFGGLALVGMAFLFVHYFIMHTVFSNPQMWKSQPEAMPPKAFLYAFIWFYLFLGFILLTGLVLNMLSGLFLSQKRHRVFSMVVAGVDCLQMPFGTALGVFTILVLSRDSVRVLYSEQAAI